MGPFEKAASNTNKSDSQTARTAARILTHLNQETDGDRAEIIFKRKPAGMSVGKFVTEVSQLVEAASDWKFDAAAAEAIGKKAMPYSGYNNPPAMLWEKPAWVFLHAPLAEVITLFDEGQLAA